MEKLQYVIEDSTIAALLGEQNFINKEAAILELVKNAYDAGATQLNISFSEDTITIVDNGVGMSEADIKQKWMHVGKSEKEYETIGIDNKARILAGSKGIGRFALARLGRKAVLFTLRKNNSAITWETDWNHSTISETTEKKEIGTRIVISALRDRWTEKAIDGLGAYLSKTYNDDKMSISITSKRRVYEVKKYFNGIRPGHNCKALICFSYDSSTCDLKTTVNSDEFEESAQSYCPQIDIFHYENKLNIFDEFKDAGWDLSQDELQEALLSVGSFNGELYFNLSSSTAEKEKFLYKYGTLAESLDSGVVLYRNAFSISAYEGKKDWLGLGKRARKSPAAATHPTGAWRVRENQLAGKIEIDKRINKQLKDLSNRQGLDENIYYELFVEIILSSLKEFERYRQDIIRAIDNKNEKELQEQPKPISDRVISAPNTVFDLSKAEAKQLAQELKSYKKESSEYKKEIANTEDRYKYDVRILNVLATTGLKASSLAHEMKNDRNFVADVNENIIDALREFGLWDYLSASERTEKTYKNVPYLLEKSKDIDQKLLVFMDTMLQEIEKRQFEPSWKSISDLLEKEKMSWEKDYSWLKVSIMMEEDICFFISEDVLRVVIDNLILNSVQQNKSSNSLHVSIFASATPTELMIRYNDDGKGLDSKYHNNPRKILEVHETTRKEGHGLGMWIVNNTINMFEGKVLEIGTGSGFSFVFTIGGTRQ